MNNIKDQENIKKSQKKEIGRNLVGREKEKSTSVGRKLKIKPKRIPLYQQKTLDIQVEPGYHYRLVTDTGNRIERFIAAGYDFVNEECLPEGRRAKDPHQFGAVACQSLGRGDIGYYMRIPLEIYEEDQKQKQHQLDENQKDIGIGALAGDIPTNRIHGNVIIDRQK